MPNVTPKASPFLNVDLEVRSRRDLTPLVDALGRSVVVLHDARRRGVHLAAFELYAAPRSPSPELYLRAWLRLLDRLPSPAQRAWMGARSRRLDVGVQADDERYTSQLAPSTLGALAKLDIELGFSIYPPS